MIYPLLKQKTELPSYYCIVVYFSLQSVNICLIYLCATILDTLVFISFISLDEVTPLIPLSLYNNLLCLKLQLLTEVYFVQCKYNYTSLSVTIFIEYHFPSIYSEQILYMSLKLKQAAYSWVLIFYLFRAFLIYSAF